MKNLDITERDGGEVLWDYMCNEGTSYVNKSGEAADAIFSDPLLMLTERGLRDVRKAVTEWVANEAAAEAVEAAHEAALPYYAQVKAAWTKWHSERILHHAVAVLDEMPGAVAWVGNVILVDYPQWSEGDSYISPVMCSPTWAQVVRLFDQAIKNTKDFYHCRLDGLYEAELEEYPEGLQVPNNTKVFRFSKGS